MSPSFRMLTSASTSSRNGTLTFVVLPVEEREALLEIESRRDVFQDESELDHGEGNLGLDAHDDGVRPAQADHVGDIAQGPSRERVDDVECRHVDDDPTGTRFPDL